MEPKLTGYAGTKIFILNNASHDTFGGVCANVGGKIEKNGFYAQVEGGYGNAAYAKAELGKDFTFGDSSFGLNTSLGGQYTVSNRTKDYYKSEFEEGGNSPTWKANDTRGYGQVSLTYNNPKVEVGLGVRAGVKTSTQPSLDGITLADVGITRGTEYAGRTTKSEFSYLGKVKYNCNEHLSLSLEKTKDSANFTASWIF